MAKIETNIKQTAATKYIHSSAEFC